MSADHATLPRSTRLRSLRSRHADVAHQVRRCEDNVARLRSDERALISAMRDLVEARARLAQISLELRHAR